MQVLKIFDIIITTDIIIIIFLAFSGSLAWPLMNSAKVHLPLWGPPLQSGLL